VTRDSLWWLHEGNRAIRSGDWKLVSAKKDANRWELYDLKTDRTEMHNLAQKHPQKVRELKAKWQQRFNQIRKLASRDVATKK